jgi:hypothetical protein
LVSHSSTPGFCSPPSKLQKPLSFESAGGCKSARQSVPQIAANIQSETLSLIHGNAFIGLLMPAAPTVNSVQDQHILMKLGERLRQFRLTQGLTTTQRVRRPKPDTGNLNSRRPPHHSGPDKSEAGHACAMGAVRLRATSRTIGARY